MGERCVDGGNWDLGVDGLVVLGGCDGDDVPWHSNSILRFELCELCHARRLAHAKCSIKCLRERVS